MRYPTGCRSGWRSLSGRVVAVAAMLVFGLASPALAQGRASLIVIPWCYDGAEALAAADAEVAQRAQAHWLDSEMVQMSLRQISLLAAADDLIQGYELDEDRQVVALVHSQLADPAAVVDKVEAALALAVNDVEGPNNSGFPTVLIFPACRQVESGPSLDAVVRSVERVNLDGIGAGERFRFAVQTDLVATQVVVSVEESNSVSDRLTERLSEAFGDDVRVEINPDHSLFWPTLALATADAAPVEPAETESAATGLATANPEPLAPRTQAPDTPEVVVGDDSIAAKSGTAPVANGPIDSWEGTAPSGVPTWVLVVGLAGLAATIGFVFAVVFLFRRWREL